MAEPTPTPTPEDEAKKTKPRFTQQLQQIFQTSIEDVLARMLGASQTLPPGPEAGARPGAGPGPLPPALTNPGAGDEAAVRERQALEQMFGVTGPGQPYVVGER